VTATDDTLIRMSGIKKIFYTDEVETHALSDVHFEIKKGEYVAISGPSGCGKTTLLQLIAGLVVPSEGTVSWWGGGHDASGERGRRLGYVFQAPTLMPWARVDANVRLPLDLAGIERAVANEGTRAALAQVGLAEFARHFPRELSGGMQMRASIARALVNTPDLLLMDEPFGALDEFTRQRLDGELAALWADRRLTVVFVTHSIYEAVFLSTRIAVMGPRPGRIIADIPIDEPFPRSDEFRVSTRFARYCRQISALIAEAGADTPLLSLP
jgi:NitT/TauT family transport system ATP-binding protein